MNIENHVFGNGDAQPLNETGEHLSFKNEFKSRLFLKAKHIIDSATDKTFDTAARFIQLYLDLGNETLENKHVIKNKLKNKFNELYGNI